MLKMMVVAGDKTTALINYLKGKGTFDVQYSYSDIHLSYEDIKSSIIKVDKFLYLCTGTSSTVKTDMQALRRLLSGAEFFYPDEIVFMASGSDEETKKSQEYFETVMKVVNFTAYDVKIVNGDIAYDDVSDFLLGITQSNNFRNKYKSVYLVDSHNKSKVSYDSSNDKKAVIEPFSYQNLERYEASKQFSDKTDSGKRVTDNEVRNLPKSTFVDIGKLKDELKIRKPFIYVFTGHKKTGVSVWSSVFSLSAYASDNKVALVDFTYNSDVGSLLKKQAVQFSSLSVTDCFKLNNLRSDKINLISLKSDKEWEVRYDFLQYISSDYNRLPVDVCVIAAPIQEIDKLLFSVRYMVAGINVCVNPIRDDLLPMYSTLATLVKNYSIKVILNETVSLMPDQNYLTAEECKLLVPSDVKIVKNINHKDFNKIGVNLFSAMSKS